jgi:TAT (twin-arginine translocation) pathway signal sequence
MRLYEITRRGFLKGLGAAGVAAATGRLPAGIAAEPAAAATAASAVEAGSVIDGLVAAATSWTVKNMGTLYLDSSYSEAPEFEEWQPGENDLTDIESNGQFGTMPWGSHFETGVSEGGVPWLHASFGDENPYEALLTYQDPNTKQFESVRLEYDPQTYGIDSTTDEEGNTVDENDVGSYVDRRVAGTLGDESEDDEPKVADVATKAAAHGAAEFGLDRLAQLAGIKALGGQKSAEDPTDIDLDTMIKNYKDTYGDVSKDQEEPLALPDKSDDEIDQILKPGSIKSKQTVKNK